MTYSTSNTYTLKREILTFSNKISGRLCKPDRKISDNMTYGRATFFVDRGYDDSKMFLKLDELEQDYVIRLTARRKHYFHGK